MKVDVRFEYAPSKNVRFCFSSIAWVYFSYKTKNFDFESLRNILINNFLIQNNDARCPVKQSLI